MGVSSRFAYTSPQTTGTLVLLFFEHEEAEPANPIRPHDGRSAARLG